MPSAAALPPGLALRAAQEADSAPLIDLVSAIYGDYPGCHLLVEAEEPDLLRPGGAYLPGGGWWVVEAGGALVGSVALRPSTARPGWGELRKLYLRAELRGEGVGAALLAFAEGEMAARGWRHAHLWTDSRFAAAHRLYARAGWHRCALTRMLADASHTTEFEYLKQLG